MLRCEEFPLLCKLGRVGKGKLFCFTWDAALEKETWRKVTVPNRVRGQHQAPNLYSWHFPFLKYFAHVSFSWGCFCPLAFRILTFKAQIYSAEEPRSVGIAVLRSVIIELACSDAWHAANPWRTRNLIHKTAWQSKRQFGFLQWSMRRHWRDRIIKNVSSGQSDGPALTPAEQKPFVSSSNKTDSFTAHQLAL